MARVNIEGEDRPVAYYMDDKLYHNLETKVKPALMDKDKDFILVIDGDEGSGKSTLAFQIGRKVDPTLTLERVTFTPESFKEAIFKAKKGQVVIYDEAFTGLSSRTSLSSINRSLVSLMMMMRQKNLCVILVLPTFFLLDKYAAIFRTKVLIHVYESKGRRGYFRIYNRKLKKMLFMFGRPTYSYPKKIRTNFIGRFYGVFALGGDKEEEEYRKKKAEALKESETNPMSGSQVKFMEQRNLLLFLLRKNLKMSYRQLSTYLSDYGIEMTFMQIRNICFKFGDMNKEEVEDDEVVGSEMVDGDKVD